MSVQRVVVTRSGGFAGLTVTTEVDDPEEAERLSAAVRSAAAQPPGRARDDFVYEFTIVTESATDRVELTGAQLPADLRPTLQELLNRRAR
ncbi:protealysin inhibitor emfourin [Amnibacterium sp.]|uniref:protealysin inhibitor emfourin n=1 Tax=Amnibacterium sp. TaxID=1872496 RepID=UPI003F7C2D81